VELRASRGRAVLIGGAGGLSLWALQWPIGEVAFALLDGSAQGEALRADALATVQESGAATLLLHEDPALRP